MADAYVRLRMELSCCCDVDAKRYVIEAFLRRPGAWEDATGLVLRLVQEGVLQRPDLRLVQRLAHIRSAPTVTQPPPASTRQGNGQAASTSSVAPRQGFSACSSPFSWLTDELQMLVEVLPADDCFCVALVNSDCHHAIRRRWPDGTRTGVAAVRADVLPRPSEPT